ncbi:MAG TPA: YgcG family protein [Burkholderiales bacterium]|nr:YgcG family protein [Burkholderiales bacterium]
MRLVLAALLAAAAALGAARAEAPVPPLQARVTDLTGTLSPQQKSELEAKLAAYEARRGSQMAVLLVPTTRPEEIEQYSIRVAEAWKIGRKGVDDGIILVVAKDDRRLRIEVGYGLEGVIPDTLARRVIDERIVPRFREGDFYGGISAGVERVIAVVNGEPLPAPPRERPDAGGAGLGHTDPMALLVPAIIFTVVVGAILKALLGRFPGSLATGAALGLVAWVLFGLAAAAIAAVVGFILTLANTGRGSGWSSGGGWSGGSSGGSSSSWGGGGGGSFGGGGSSGRW